MSKEERKTHTYTPAIFYGRSIFSFIVTPEQKIKCFTAHRIKSISKIDLMAFFSFNFVYGHVNIFV